MARGPRKQQAEKTPASVVARTGAIPEETPNNSKVGETAQWFVATKAGRDLPHGRLARSFWDDPRVQALSGDAERLLIYCYASSQAWSDGFYRMSWGKAADDLRLSRKKVDDARAVLVSAGFVELDSERGLLLVVGAMALQLPTSGSGVRGWAKHAVQYRTSPLFGRYRELLAYFLEGKGTHIAQTLPGKIAQLLDFLPGGETGRGTGRDGGRGTGRNAGELAQRTTNK